MLNCKNTKFALEFGKFFAVVRFCFDLAPNRLPLLQKLRSSSTKSKSLLWNLRCALEIKKIKLRFYNGSKDRCALPHCAFVKMLFVFTYGFHAGRFLGTCNELLTCLFIMTQKFFSNIVVYLATCGGDLVAVDNQQVFLTPINRRDFLSNNVCEWNIRTNSINEEVVLSLNVVDIEKENDLAVLVRQANIPDESNLTTLLIQVKRCALYYASN